MGFTPVLSLRLKFKVQVESWEYGDSRIKTKQETILSKFTKLVNGRSGIVARVGLTPKPMLLSTVWSCLSEKLLVQGHLPSGWKGLWYTEFGRATGRDIWIMCHESKSAHHCWAHYLLWMRLYAFGSCLTLSPTCVTLLDHPIALQGSQAPWDLTE